MSKNKTIQNDGSILHFLENVEDEIRRKDALTALEFMKDITETKPMMWGDSIIGFGKYHYKYDSGREGVFFKVGFSPRKSSMTFYIMTSFPELELLLAELGKHKRGKSCLYINRLSQVDVNVLKQIIALSFQRMNEKYGIEN